MCYYLADGNADWIKTLFVIDFLAGSAYDL